jgi:amino acid adenylation domain-containing protein
MDPSAIDLSRLSPQEKRELLRQLLREQAQSFAFPMSHGQQALWFLYRLAPQSAAYNFKLSARFRGPLDLRAMRRTCEALVDRHPLLRTTFASTDAGGVQRVHEQLPLDLPVIDARGWSESELHDHVERSANRPFNLEREASLRIHLYQRSPVEHVLLLMCHHIAIDFWSFRILIDDLVAIYASQVTGFNISFPPVEHSYADFVTWQRAMLAGPEGAQHRAYWQQKLAGELPVLNLPTDRPRPPVQTFQGTSHWRTLSAALSSDLETLARTSGTSLYTLLVAAFQVLLHRYTGQDDILVGTPMAGRSRAEFQDILGFFVNTVALRGNLAGDPPFRAFLDQVRATVMEALDHQDYPFSLVVQQTARRRDLSRSPLLQVMLAWDKVQRIRASGIDLSGRNAAHDARALVVESTTLEQQGAAFDLVLQVFEEAGQPLRLCFGYNTDLFDASTIARMDEHFQCLLESLVTDPNQPVGRLALFREDQRRQLVAQAHATTAGGPPATCIHEWFEARAAECPDRQAVIWQDEQFTYQQLNCRANQLAHYLQSLGVGPDICVGICLEHPPDTVRGILAILKAGGAYVPLDPTHGRERLAYLLADTKAAVLLTESHLAAKLFDGLVQGPQIVCLDTAAATIAEQPADTPPPLATAEHLAYVMYTSGSTGRPNGVPVTHGNLTHSMSARVLYYRAFDGRFLLLSPWAFDASIAGLFGTLCQGGTLVLPPVGWQQALNQLPRLIDEYQINRIVCIPWLWGTVLAAARPEQLASLVSVIVEADVCAKEVTERHLAMLPGIMLYNEYGPTEATVWCTVFALEAPVTGSVVPIGRPIPNTPVYILDRYRQPVPVGVPGEIYVGGPGVTPGYLNQPQLTRQRFLPDPFRGDPAARLYQTGDLGRWLPDGNIEFLGRADRQVKVNGCRIELDEIETVLMQHPAVDQAVVAAHQHAPGDTRLTAYVVFHGPLTPEPPPALNELRGFLSERLPKQMVPGAFLRLAVLPTNAHGKVDRAALPAPTRTRVDMSATFVAPRNPIEHTLARVWADVLELDKVGIHDDFFDLGGASNQVLQVLTKAQTEGLALAPEMIFKYPTIAELAAAYEGPRPAAGNTRIESLGVYLPPRIVTTAEVLRNCATKIEFDLEKLTGIHSRRMAGEEEFSIDLAARAIEDCFARSRYAPEDIDLLICCNISRFDGLPWEVTYEPSTSVRLAARFGFQNALTFDVSNACAGMFTGVYIANLMMKLGLIDCALVVSGEYITHLTRTAQREIAGDLDPRMPCLTLGDAGAAVILEPSADTQVGFHTIDLFTLGQYSRLCIAKLSERKRSGPIMITDVLGVSSVTTKEAAGHWPLTALRHGWGPQDVQHVIPHQVSDTSLANGLYEARQLGIINGINVVSNVAERANTASTTHFVALADHVRQGHIRSGDNVLFGVSGSGMTMGAALYTLDDLPDRLRAAPPETPRPPAAGVRFRARDRNCARPPRVAIESIGTVPDLTGGQPNAVEFATIAAEKCLAGASHDRRDLGLLLYAGVYRNEFLSEPAIASMVAGSLGLNRDADMESQRALAFDVFNGGLGFLDACYVAIQAIKFSGLKAAMVVTAEIENNVGFPNPQWYGLKETGSAIVLSPSPDGAAGFGRFVFHTVPEQIQALRAFTVDDEEHGYLRVQRAADLESHFLAALKRAVDELLAREGVTLADPKVIFPPQISPDFITALAQILGVPRSQLVDVSESGKDLLTSSLPYAFQHAKNRGLCQPGDWGLVLGVGSGIQAAAAVYHF